MNPTKDISLSCNAIPIQSKIAMQKTILFEEKLYKKYKYSLWERRKHQWIKKRREKARQQQMMLKKAFQDTLKGALVYNKHEVKMERKNPDKISIRLRAFFGCQQPLEIQCTLLAEQLAIKEEGAMVNTNLRMESRWNQGKRRWRAAARWDVNINDISITVCCRRRRLLDPLLRRILCGSCIWSKSTN